MATRRKQEGIQVAVISYFEKSSASVKQLMLTDADSYTAMGKPAIPILSSLFDYNEKLFKGGTLFGAQDNGLGEIEADATGGILDSYRFEGFDGQRIQIYQLQDKYELLDDQANLLFTGTQDFPEFGLKTVTFHIKNRMQELTVQMQNSVFSGGVPADLYPILGPSADYEANPGDPDYIEEDFEIVYPPPGADQSYINRLEGEENLAGKQKPMVFGRCHGIPLVCVNDSQSIYACNYDVDGNRIPIYRFLRIYDKGTDILVSGDVPNSAALFATAPAGGYCYTCVAEGLVKFGQVPLGDATADVDECPLAEASAPKVAARILMRVMKYIQGSDFNQYELDRLHAMNACPVGYFISGTDKVIDVLTMVLGSIGAWMLPDHLGVFRFGRFDLPDASTQPVATYSNDQIYEGSLSRPQTGDDNRGIPAQQVILRHTKQWAVLNKGQTLESLPDYIRTFMANAFRSARAANPAVLAAHPSAPTLTFNTVLVRGQRALIRNADFSFDFGFITSPKADWTNSSPAGTTAVIGTSGVLTLTASASNVATVYQVINNPNQFTAGLWRIGFSNLGASNVSVIFQNGLTTLGSVIFNNGDPSLPDKSSVISVPEGMSSITITVKNTYMDSSGKDKGIVDNIYMSELLPGLSPSQEASRRLGIASEDTECFKFTVSVQDSMNARIGQPILLKLDDRFDLFSGKKFIITEKDFSTSKNEVELTVVG